MTTLVTGASGFLGGAVVRALLEEGRQVRALDLVEGPTLEDLDVEYVKGDVLVRESLERAFRGVDSVYHLVALISIAGDPAGKVRRINVEGVRNVAEAALHAGVNRMVHCSSVHAFDLETDGRVLTEESPRATAPWLPPYDRSKAEGEFALREAMDDGLDAVIVNPTGIIGIYDYQPSPMGQVFRALLAGGLPLLPRGGFDWVDSRDVASSMIAAEAEGTPGENYLLPGHQRSLAELAEMVGEVSGHIRSRRIVPLRLARIWGPLGRALHRRSGSALTFTTESLHALEHSPTVSGDKARLELGHTPRTIEQTVSDICHWFEARSPHSSSS